MSIALPPAELTLSRSPNSSSLSISNIEDESYVRIGHSPDWAVGSDESTDVSPRLGSPRVRPLSQSVDRTRETFDEHLRSVKVAHERKEQAYRELERHTQRQDAQYHAKLQKHEEDKAWWAKLERRVRVTMSSHQEKMRRLEEDEAVLDAIVNAANAKCTCDACQDKAEAQRLKDNLRVAQVLLEELQGQLNLERQSNLSLRFDGQHPRDFHKEAMEREIASYS